MSSVPVQRIEQPRPAGWRPDRLRAVRWRPAVGALLIWGAMAATASADEALAKKIASVALNISKLLQTQSPSVDAISIGAFSGPPTFPSSSGPAFVQLFTDAFQKHGITVKTRASIGLTGEYTLTEIEQKDEVSGRLAKRLAVQINGRLVDNFGKTVTRFNALGIQEGAFQETVSGPEAVVETIGLPADLPVESPGGEIDQKLRESLVKPPVVLDAKKTRYKVSADSPYEIEILVDGAPCPIVLEDDLPYVTVQKGQTYAIRVYNNSDYDAAVKVLIDGLSVFHFSEIRNAKDPGKPKYSVFIVGPKDSPTLKGWHKTNEHVASFLVAAFEESAAAKLGHKSDIGTILVTFAAAWPHGSPPPPDEAVTRSAGGDVGTAEGPPLEQKVQEAVRDIGKIRASLAIRYKK